MLTQREEELVTKIFQVDAFTHEPFKGNPAAVCILEIECSEDWMKSVALEMNLSETAFLRRQPDGYDLRWFTPRREVNLCGHATLATAHILWETGRLAPDQPARFHTKSGLLTATREGDWIAIDFPARLATPADPNPDVNRAIGVSPISVQKATSPQGDIYLLQVESAQSVRSMTPDFVRLAATGIRSVIITARSDSPGCDFVSRYLAPGVGVNEDPVTGSAHCYLTPFWGTKLGKNSMVGYQASHRPGFVRCEWNGERVILKGQAVTIMIAELLV
jgi:PhzF family phenazine biosynthesis protein